MRAAVNGRRPCALRSESDLNIECDAVLCGEGEQTVAYAWAVRLGKTKGRRSS